MAADGSNLRQLTHNSEEERAPAWSPDATRIAYSCRRGPATGRFPTFELCVMNADGSNVVQVTYNSLPDLTPTWIDNTRIVLHRQIAGGNELFQIDVAAATETQLTNTVGHNLLAKAGRMVVRPVAGK